MINKYEVVEKTKEDALEELKIITEKELNELYFSEQEVESGSIIKKKKYKINAVKKEEVIEYIKNYFNHLSYFSNINIKSEVRENEDIISVILVSNNNPVLIGKDGKNLNSIQMMLRTALTNQTGQNIKINIDAANYKNKKLKYLERDIKNIIREIKSTKEDATLDPMNSFERRFVHNLVSEHEDLMSESTGAGKERKITIKYKG